MTRTYNHNRPYSIRDKRYEELSDKRCVPSEAKYCVVTTRDGADGDFRDGFSNDRHYFKNCTTAVAFAQHYSDIEDHVAGVFKMPEFICRVDVR